MPAKVYFSQGLTELYSIDRWSYADSQTLSGCSAQRMMTRVMRKKHQRVSKSSSRKRRRCLKVMKKRQRMIRRKLKKI